jgi:hypothetical protein
MKTFKPLGQYYFNSNELDFIREALVGFDAEARYNKYTNILCKYNTFVDNLVPIIETDLLEYYRLENIQEETICQKTQEKLH